MHERHGWSLVVFIILEGNDWLSQVLRKQTLTSALAQVMAKDAALTAANARYQEMASQMAEKQQELENNAGAVFLLWLLFGLECNAKPEEGILLT